MPIPSDELLRRAYSRYASLKKDHAYLACYKSLAELHSLLKNPRSRTPELACIYTDLFDYITTHWELKFVINPMLDIDADAPLLKNAEIMQSFLIAFGFIKENKEPFLYGFFTRLDHRKTRKASKDKRAKEKDVLKVLTYLLRMKGKLSADSVHRMFTISKDTVEAWTTEIENRPPEEVASMINVLFYGRHLPNRDALV